MQTPPRPPPGPLVAPPAPRRNRAGPANARFAGPARPRVLVPPLIFGNGGMPPPGGEPARSRSRTQKQKQQKRKQKQTRKQK